MRFFSLLTVWALSVARKNFKVKHHPLLPRIYLGLIALQFSDYYVYEHALHKKKLQFHALCIDMFCKIPTTYTYYLFQKVLTDCSV